MPKHLSLSQAQYYTKTIAFILLSSKVIPSYSYCVKEGLVYIAIAALSGYQSLFYSKCTSLNIQSSYNIRSVSNAEYIYTRLISL